MAISSYKAPTTIDTIIDFLKLELNISNAVFDELLRGYSVQDFLSTDDLPGQSSACDTNSTCIHGSGVPYGYEGRDLVTRWKSIPKIEGVRGGGDLED